MAWPFLTSFRACIYMTCNSRATSNPMKHVRTRICRNQLKMIQHDTIVATPIQTSLQWFTVTCWGTWKNFLRYFGGQSWASSSAQDLTQLLLTDVKWTIYMPSIHLLYLLLHLLLSTSMIHAILNQSNPRWPYFSDLVNASPRQCKWHRRYPAPRTSKHEGVAIQHKFHQVVPALQGQLQHLALLGNCCMSHQAVLMGNHGKPIRRVRLAGKHHIFIESLLWA